MILIKTLFAIVSFHLPCITQAVDACTAIQPTPEEKGHVLNTVHELGRKLSFAKWNDDPSSNVVLSPLSIATVLNLLMVGTNGITNSEIKQALNYSDDLEECAIHKIYQNIFNSLQQQSESEVEISLNTKLFPQENFPILDLYISISKTYYFTEVQNLDYFNSPKLATETINEWVSNNTKGKIEKLFEEDLSIDTKFVIANVIFFNATWENKFDPVHTKNGTFEAESGNIPILMMKEDMTVPFLMDTVEDLEMIELPYVGGNYSMFIIKPSSVNRLKEIEGSITQSKLDNLINLMKPTTLEVIIPRMKLDLNLDLKIVLPETLGINEIFSPTADFTRMSNINGLFISKFIHKAILEIGEEGTVAAAATAAVGGLTGSLGLPTFKLDKPSLLFIRKKDTPAILFWARVMEPEPIWE